RKRL
ncbi:hypothetical protein BN1723_017854, partial [Verticillium longisporum]